MQNGKARVLMIGPDRCVHGGISSVVNNYFEAGLDKKIKLKYISTMVEGSKLRKLMQATKAYFQFCLIIYNYNIVHVNVASDNSYYRKCLFIWTANKLHKKIVIHQHGGNFEEFYYRQLSERGRRKVKKTFSMGDSFLVLAPIWKDFFKNIVAEEKITVLPNSIAIPEAFTKQYGKHKILFLGRICREKGIGELLEIMPELSDKYPDIQLYLGGIWEDKDLKSIADKQKEHVKVIGWVIGEEKKKYLNECDIFVLPSYFEGQPISILEAMAYYCTVLASDIDGITQMIQENSTGKLCQSRNAESLKQGLELLLSNPSLCAALGSEARKKVEREFSISKNIDDLLHIYQGVLDKHD